MNTNGLWVIEYSFFFDSYTIRTLADSIERAQDNYRKQRLHPFVIISVYDSEQKCREDYEASQATRDALSLSVDHRLKEFQSGVDGLKAKL
jgi:hypothetical protein